MKSALTLLAISALLALAGCGDTKVEAATANVLTGTATLANGTAIAAGGCVTVGATVSGATNNMAVVVSSAADPQAAGLASPMLFSGFVDANDHVTVRACKIASPNVTATSDVTLNIRVIS